MKDRSRATTTGVDSGRGPDPAGVVLPSEVYTPERKAQFLLSNAIDAADYAGTVAEVRRMGLDPKTIPHYKPRGF